jgi:shikimate dehydrogenase
MEVSGATRLFPIIGDPVTHVESPVRLTRTFAERGHDGVCIPVQVGAGHLGVVMAALAASGNVDGVLVTMPHKSAAFGYCATSSERARKLGVVSVIRRNPDRTWHGDMLDGLAFVKAQVDHGARVEGARALLVGAGAAGAASAIALLEAGVGELIVHDADASRIADLLPLLAGHGAGRVRSGPPDPHGCDLLFNATPLGMESGDPLPVDAALLQASMFVGDVVSGHGATPFVRAARDTGCQTATGADMVEAVQALMADFMIGGQRPRAID